VSTPSDDDGSTHDEAAPTSDDRHRTANAEEAGPVDQLGIPMSREPTLDDVRGDGEQHRKLALGCTLLVIALLASFYGFRVLALR
jgi:hypothetical protein